MSCSKLYLALGVKKENLVMLDSKGVIRNNREGLEGNKEFFATNRRCETLEDAMKNADVFLGLSVANIVSTEMVQSMAKRPIVFALANPDPEISVEDVFALQRDLTEAGADWQVHNYGNTMHAFTNPVANDPDFGTVYQSDADRRSWVAMKSFLSEVFE